MAMTCHSLQYLPMAPGINYKINLLLNLTKSYQDSPRGAIFIIVCSRAVHYFINAVPLCVFFYCYSLYYSTLLLTW